MFKAPIWSAIICQRQIVVYGKQDNLDNFILRSKVRLNFFLGISIFNFPIADAKSKKVRLEFLRVGRFSQTANVTLATKLAEVAPKVLNLAQVVA